MFNFVLGALCGLFVGWVMLPAPASVTAWWTAHKPW